MELLLNQVLRMDCEGEAEPFYGPVGIYILNSRSIVMRAIAVQTKCR